MNKEKPKQHRVKDDYNKIATQFASTRKYEWPEMKIFSDYIESRQKVLDLGCGNGRLIKSLIKKNVEYLGIDNSEELIRLARKTHPDKNFKVMSMEDLRLPNNSFDAVFMIASLHHLKTKNLRVLALKEASRVLKKDGYFFVTVWDLWQRKYQKYIWKNLSDILFKHSKTRFGDTFIPWKDPQKNTLVNRYYFAYTARGLRKNLQEAGFEITEIKHSKWNIYAICKKTDF